MYPLREAVGPERVNVPPEPRSTPIMGCWIGSRATTRRRWPPKPRAAADDRVVMRSLSFDTQEELAPSLLQEVEEHRWTVAGRNAYPVVLCVTVNKAAIAITEKDVRILTAVTRAFLAFFVRHRELFELEDPEMVRESSQGADGLEVTLTAPYTLFGDEGIRRAPPRRDVGSDSPG